MSYMNKSANGKAVFMTNMSVKHWTGVYEVAHSLHTVLPIMFCSLHTIWKVWEFPDWTYFIVSNLEGIYSPQLHSEYNFIQATDATAFYPLLFFSLAYEWNI